MPAYRSYYHIYNNGVNNKTIFRDKDDRQVFIGYLNDYLSKPGDPKDNKQAFTIRGRTYKGTPYQRKNYHDSIELISYRLTENSFQLLLHQKSDKSLEKFMRSLCTRYSMYFNKKYNDSGSLFNGPYKSKQIRDEKELSELKRAINDVNINSDSFKGQNKRNNPLKYGAEKEPFNKSGFAFLGIMFVILFSFGLRNVMASGPAENKKVLGITGEQAVELPLPVLEIEGLEDRVSLNILSDPDVGSEIIGTANNGDKFEFVYSDSLWYKIKLGEDSYGFILTNHVKEIDKNE